MELISLRQVSPKAKIALLKELGYGSDGKFVTSPDGSILKDRYTFEPVRLDNMLILPGSTVIIDENPLSIANYFEEFGETF